MKNAMLRFATVIALSASQLHAVQNGATQGNAVQVGPGELVGPGQPVGPGQAQADQSSTPPCSSSPSSQVLSLRFWIGAAQVRRLSSSRGRAIPRTLRQLRSAVHRASSCLWHYAKRFRRVEQTSTG